MWQSVVHTVFMVSQGYTKDYLRLVKGIKANFMFMIELECNFD